MTDVVVVDDLTNLCQVYSFFPFGKNRCFDMSPLLMASWKKPLSGSLNTTLAFYPDKLLNLHMCTLQVEYGSLVKALARSTTPGAGIAFFLLDAMKATPNIIPHVNGSFPRIIDKRTDLLYSLFYQNIDRSQKFTFSPISLAVHSGICFPVQERTFVEWMRILDEFSCFVWCGIAISAAMVTFYGYFIFFQRKVDFSLVVLITLRSLTNASQPQIEFRRWQDRVCFPLWLYLCLVLDSAYKSTLKSKLTVPFVNDPISSIEDFKNLDIPIYVTYDAHKFAIETMLNEPEHKAIRDKMIVFKNLTSYELLKKDKDVAYICQEEDFEIYLNGSHRVLQDLLFENFFSIFLLPKPSPYERLFKKAFLRIYTAGALHFVKDYFRHSRKWKRRKDRNTSISLRTLSGAFMVLILGYCGAVVFFLGEIFVVKLSKVFEKENRKKGKTDICRVLSRLPGPKIHCISIHGLPKIHEYQHP